MINSLIATFYKFIAYPLLKISWFVLRPKTNSVKVVIQYQNQILFVKNTYYKSNFWFLPGGTAKNNEEPETAAVREVKEELNINLKNLKNCGQFSFINEYKRDTIWVYLAKISNSNFKIDQQEIKEAKWIKIKDFSKFSLSPNTNKCLRIAGII